MSEPPQMEDKTRGDPLLPRGLVRLALLFEGGLGILAGLLGLVFDISPLHAIYWDVRDVLLGLLATAPMVLMFFACLRWPVGPLARIKEVSEEVIGLLFARCSLAELALISLMAGVGEEMLFRGFLQGLLAARYGWLLGLALASLLFGLMHPITATYAVLATLLGVYLGGIWLWSGNLLVPILAHALYDFAALAYLVKGHGGRPSLHREK